MITETTAMQRLGSVCYWLGNIIALIILIFAVVVFVVMHGSANSADVSSAPIVAVMIAVCGIISWGVGRALRYVLSGY